LDRDNQTSSLNYAALDLLERLRLLGKPEAYLVGSNARQPTERELRSGRFTIWNRSTIIHTPVDWLQDPFLSRSWRFQLNTLSWLKPLLLAHAESGERDSLTVARDLSVDWAKAHMQPDTRNEFAWYDMVVGLRSPYIAYVLRACLMEDMLNDSDAVLLLESALRHGAELAKQENYSAQHNHGLFQDEGLYLLAKQLPLLPSARSWRELALRRLRSTLDQTICVEEGGHLEHSSSYQFSITSLVSRLADNVPEMDGLSELQRRLALTSQWHVTPANQVAQLGDTDDVPAPAQACHAASNLHGLNALFGTGQAFVREDGSYLAVTAAHHSAAHKQADETGFLLVEKKTVILGDAGRWGYYENEPDRVYARSAAAHNVLTVDNLDFQWRRATPYGSGLLAAGHSDHWYAIVVHNRTLGQQGVDHRRLLLYRPGCVLLIVDDVCSDEPHDYARYFHFGPDVTAELTASQVTLSNEHLSATLTNFAGNTSVALHRGLDSPSRLGWTYPADRVRTEVSTAVLSTRARSSQLMASLTLRASCQVTSVKGSADHLFLELSDLQALEVRLKPDQKAVEILSFNKLD
jgi:Heparinase II/III-like protein/Heparinase II/III N-terminus